MTGGPLKRSRIKLNIIRILLSQLDGSSFDLLNGDMRVGIGEGRYVYPDLRVVFDEAQLTDDDMTLLNPIVAAEVTSPSSLNYDRLTKRDSYRALSGLQAYLIVDQQQCLAELHRREEIGWLHQTFGARSEVIPLPMLNCSLALAEVYRGTGLSDD